MFFKRGLQHQATISHRTNQLLHAGLLEMRYEQGSLRNIKANGEEVLNMVYVALRDANWETFQPLYSNEKINAGTDHFTVSYHCHYTLKGKPVFKWKVDIEGTRTNEIFFHIHGEALTSFKKNRAGLCILHPVKTSSGQPCEITAPDGSVSRHLFPILIAPHQPFKNIREMHWETTGNHSCIMKLEGDIFETEDQRNWTDASFKTYSTPLEKPFPVLLQKGDAISQSLKFSIDNAGKGGYPLPQSATPGLISIQGLAPVKIPALGTLQSFPDRQMHAKTASLIGRLHLAHYRVDLYLSEKDWSHRLLQGANNCLSIQSRLELVLHLPDNDDTVLTDFIRLANSLAPLIEKIVVWGPTKVTSDQIIKKYVPRLKKDLSQTLIGGGTDYHYAELGRNLFDPGELDFISFSITPQVHATDNQTILENLEAQTEVVKNARCLYGLPIHVSSVTLKPRSNPDATENPSSGAPQIPGVDMRQTSLFAAGWTLGSIRQLAVADAAAISYYEAEGTRGLLRGPDSHQEQSLRGENSMVYPVYIVLSLIQEFAGGKLYAGLSNDPLKYNGILLRAGKRQRWILANHVEEPMAIKIDHLPKASSIKTLDTSTMPEALLDPEAFLRSHSSISTHPEIKLNAYGIGIVDIPE